MLSGTDIVSQFLKEISLEDGLPFLVENPTWDDKILPVIIEWAVVASASLRAFLLCQPILRRIIENVYVLGVRDGVRRANSPFAELLEDAKE